MKKDLKKSFIIIWIAAVSIALIALGVSAAYTNVNKVKRVVSTQGGAGTAFSSNYLMLVNGNTNERSFDVKRITFSQNEESKQINVSVSNFVHNNPSIVNEYTIKYSLRITFTNAVTNDRITEKPEDFVLTQGDNTIIFDSTNGGYIIPNQTLTENTGSTLYYNLTIPKSFIDSINVNIEAVPDETCYNYTNQSKLARTLTFSEYVENTTLWTGKFIETEILGYDGFNYLITGQGTGKVTLTWDPTIFDMNEVFISANNLTPTTDSDGKKSFTLNVDSAEKNRYDIQFYKVQGHNYVDEDLKSVKFTFTESSSEDVVTDVSSGW